MNPGSLTLLGKRLVGKIETCSILGNISETFPESTKVAFTRRKLAVLCNVAISVGQYSCAPRQTPIGFAARFLGKRTCSSDFWFI